jgi:hypothetical protein
MVFNCSKHPKVIAGEMSEEQVFAQFLKNFNDYGEGKIDRKVSIIYAGVE